MFIPDPGSDFFPSWIPDPNFFYPGSRILIKEFKYVNPKKWFLSSRKYDPGCSSRIRILTFCPSRIQGFKKHRIPDPDPQHWLELCLPSLIPRNWVCVSPLEPKGRGATLACGWGDGGTQFERLDRKPGTLYNQLVMSYLYFSFWGDDRLCVDTLTSQWSVLCTEYTLYPLGHVPFPSSVLSADYSQGHCESFGDFGRLAFALASTAPLSMCAAFYRLISKLCFL